MRVGLVVQKHVRHTEEMCEQEFFIMLRNMNSLITTDKHNDMIHA